MSLQRRVLAYLVLAVAVCCTLTVAVAIVLVRHHVEDQRSAALGVQADALSAALSPRPGAARVFRLSNGRVARIGPLRAAFVARAVTAGSGSGDVTIAGRQLRYAVHATSSGGRVIVVAGTKLAFAEWRPFLWAVIVAGFGGALLAVLLSLILARRLARPIDRLADATRRLAAGEPQVAVPVEGNDELAELGHAFNAMAGELTRSREAQRGFLESVSHELKTPLTAIRGYGEALTEGAAGAGEAGAIITAESARLERLVSDLLDLARFGRADFVAAREPIDLAAVASETVARHLPRARALGVTLRHTGEPGAAGLGDAQRLLQATSNLVENALRLTPAGGEVRVTAAGSSLTVSDDGPGLADEELPHAFERFYLHRRYRSERAVGSGLGLAIVRELVEAMGGSVKAAHGGRSGRAGAEFTLTLSPLPAAGVRPDPGPAPGLWAGPATPGSPAPPGAGRPSA